MSGQADPAQQKQLTVKDLISGFYADYPQFSSRAHFMTGEEGALPATPAAIRAALQKCVRTEDDTACIEKLMEDAAEMGRKPGVVNAVLSDGFRVFIVTGFEAAGMTDEARKIFDDSLCLSGELGALFRAACLQNADHDLAMLFDHEVGHIVTRDLASPWREKKSYHAHIICNANAESAADAYCTLRHVQRFGTETGFPAFLAAARCRGMIFRGDVEHYTTAAIQEAASAGISTADPEKTRALAIGIADRCMILQKDGTALRDYFLEYRGDEGTIVMDAPYALIKVMEYRALNTKSRVVKAAVANFAQMTGAVAPNNSPLKGGASITYEKLSEALAASVVEEEKVAEQARRGRLARIFPALKSRLPAPLCKILRIKKPAP